MIEYDTFKFLLHPYPQKIQGATPHSAIAETYNSNDSDVNQPWIEDNTAPGWAQLMRQFPKHQATVSQDGLPEARQKRYNPLYFLGFTHLRKGKHIM